jgi:hypothetical protein
VVQVDAVHEIRPKTDKRPVPRTAFKPGQSGNPGGRPKRTAEEFALIEACRQKSPEALGVIEHLMKHAEKDAVRLAAAIFIIERGYGKHLPAGEAPPPNLTQYNLTINAVKAPPRP